MVGRTFGVAALAGVLVAGLAPASSAAPKQPDVRCRDTAPVSLIAGRADHQRTATTPRAALDQVLLAEKKARTVPGRVADERFTRIAVPKHTRWGEPTARFVHRRADRSIDVLVELVGPQNRDWTLASIRFCHPDGSDRMAPYRSPGRTPELQCGKSRFGSTSVIADPIYGAYDRPETPTTARGALKRWLVRSGATPHEVRARLRYFERLPGHRGDFLELRKDHSIKAVVHFTQGGKKGGWLFSGSEMCGSGYRER